MLCALAADGQVNRTYMITNNVLANARASNKVQDRELRNSDL